tara:strand:+ start:174 stop:635 length:462 start_codon:yes stop_codon:yes gene_type:complete
MNMFVKFIVSYLKYKNKYHLKIFGLIGLIVLFSFFYLALDTTHFQGINPVQDKVKDDIVERESKKVSLESFQFTINSSSGQNSQELKQNIEEQVEAEEDKIQRPTVFQNLFDRFYFSTITACLLGYGDIYPATNIAKSMAALQSFLTVCLILY